MTGSIVAAYTDHHGDRFALFEHTLKEGRFFEVLDNACRASGKGKNGFFIVIKPNISMMLRRADIGTYTDPFFVIHLLRLLLTQGYTRLAVVESGNLYGNWFENRSVVQVAARAGYFDESAVYREDTPKTHDIHVRGGGVDARIPLIDLSSDIIVHDFGGEPALIGKTWADADFRMTVSGLKTHFYSYYTAAIKNVYGCLPEQDKVRAYHCKKRVGPWTACLIVDFPVHYSVVAAHTAADGWMGVKMKAIFVKPHTIVAGEDIQAVDRVCAWLIGIPPEKNVIYRCLAHHLNPKSYRLKGNARPFKKWRNVPRLLPLVSRLMEANAHVMDFGGSIATGGSDPCFPLKESGKSLMKKAVYHLSQPVSFLCDFGIVQLNIRRRRFFLALRSIAGKTPFLSMHPFIFSRLEFFSGEDITVLIGFAGMCTGEKVTCSGHYLVWGENEAPFPSRFTVAVLASAEILNYVRTRGQLEEFRTLASELETLQALHPKFFRGSGTYPYCYR